MSTIHFGWKKVLLSRHFIELFIIIHFTSILMSFLINSSSEAIVCTNPKFSEMFNLPFPIHTPSFVQFWGHVSTFVELIWNDPINCWVSHESYLRISCWLQQYKSIGLTLGYLSERMAGPLNCAVVVSESPNSAHAHYDPLQSSRE